jgi:single-strand DNA-binding protein
MNKVFLLGRLVRDPEIRTTQSGKMVTTFTLAVDRFGGGKDNNADFISIVTWEKLAENCGNSLTKGQRALVEGRLQIRSFEGKDGQKRWVTEIIAQSVEFLDRRSAVPATSTPEGNAPHDAAAQFGQDVAPDDEIPF